MRMTILRNVKVYQTTSGRRSVKAKIFRYIERREEELDDKEEENVNQIMMMMKWKKRIHQSMINSGAGDMNDRFNIKEWKESKGEANIRSSASSCESQL